MAAIGRPVGLHGRDQDQPAALGLLREQPRAVRIRDVPDGVQRALQAVGQLVDRGKEREQRLAPRPVVHGQSREVGRDLARERRPQTLEQVEVDARDELAIDELPGGSGHEAPDARGGAEVSEAA
jgi:hypothetical protein